MNTIIKVKLAKFRENETTDSTAFEALSVNAKKLYNLLYACGKAQGQVILTLDVSETSNTLQITPDEFIAAVNELNNQEYFMYKVEEGKYIFGNARMVY